MRARSLLPLLIAVTGAGCFHDRGTALEVDVSAAPDTTKVELFLSTTQCSLDRTYCRAIKPEGEPREPGDVWLRDSTTRITADVKGHKATFHLESDGSIENISKVIAIGTHGSTTTGALLMNNLSVPKDDAKIITVNLAASGANATEDRALIWPADGATSCAMVEHVDSVGVPSRTYIVPDNDADCDGYPNGTDCTPSAYLGTSARENAPACIVQPSEEDQPCMVGAVGCQDDNMAKVITCAPEEEPICLPKALCAVCPTSFPLCAPDFDSLPRIECTVPPDGRMCNQRDATIDLTPYVPGSCTDAQIAAYPANDYHDKLMTMGHEIDLSIDKSDCQLKLSWKPGMSGGLEQPASIKVLAARGSVVLPTVIKFDGPACDDENRDRGITCTTSGFDAADPMWSCVAP